MDCILRSTPPNCPPLSVGASQLFPLMTNTASVVPPWNVPLKSRLLVTFTLSEMPPLTRRNGDSGIPPVVGKHVRTMSPDSSVIPSALTIVGHDSRSRRSAVPVLRQARAVHAASVLVNTQVMSPDPAGTVNVPLVVPPGSVSPSPVHDSCEP